MIPVNRPLISEEDRAAIKNSLENTWISGETPPIAQMEEKLAATIGVQYAVAVSTGTTALDLAVEGLDIHPGDECVVPAFTIISTISNLLRKQAKIILVDSDPITWSMDSDQTVAAINERTKIIIPVHIYGLPVDMDSILTGAKKFESFVLEDAAEAIGLKYRGRNCGSLGDAGIFSFYANKVVTGGEGGAVVTNDAAFATKIRSLRNLCFDPKERYVHRQLGWNARMSGMSATLIYSQLGRLEELIERKTVIGQQYLEGLSGHPWLEFHPPKVNYATNTYWVFGVLLNELAPFNAQELQIELRTLGVDSRRFFCPMHLQPIFEGYEIKKQSDLKVSEKLWERGIYLPSGIGITNEEIESVIRILWKIVKK